MRLRRLLSLVLVFSLLLGQGVLALEPLDGETMETPDPGETVRVMVLLEGGGTASGDGLYAEGCDPERVKADLEEAVPELQVAHEFSALFSGISADVPCGELDTLRDIAGVADVWVATAYEAPELLETEAGRADGGLPYSMPGAAATGAGTLIAMLDTGINLTHEAFAVNTAILGDVSLTEAEASQAQTGVEGTYVSEKIPFAYDYAEQDGDVTDHNGHGTHVSGIAAGYVEESDGAVTFSGGAPGAQLAIMKIFNDSSGSTTADVYFAALEDAYLLGADVVSMSLGTACGFTYDRTLDTALFGNIYETLDQAGVIVCCAAGNNASQARYNSYVPGSVLADYADYGTVASPSSYSGNISVANAAGEARVQYFITLGTDTIDYTEPMGRTGAFAAALGGETLSYVAVQGYGTPTDYETADVSGKIALVQRGELTFEEKAQNAARAGAVGLIVCNTDDSQITMQIRESVIPVALVTYSAGQTLYSATEQNLLISETGRTSTTTQSISPSSGWGTTPDLTIDPSLSGVGTNVLSAGISGDSSYRYSSGTSMATPRVAGELAVLLSHLMEHAPNLTRGQRAVTAESMAQSGAQLLESETTPVSVRQQGAGRADAAGSLANTAYLEMPLQELGDDPAETGVYEMTLTLKNTDLIGMACGAELFSDVSESDWFHEETDFVCHKGILQGTGDSSFSPLRELTRAEAMTALYRMAGSPEPTEDCSFTDVPQGEYYTEAVAWAQEQGITRGTGGGRFSPDMLLTREQLVTMLHRFLGQPEGQGDLGKYLDGDTTEAYAREAWRWAVAQGVVNSTSTDLLLLSPVCTATRAELAALLYRILGGDTVAASYTPSVMVYSDSAEAQLDGTSLNSLDRRQLDCTVEYSVQGPVEFTGGTEARTLDVTIRLTEASKAYLQENFPNGTYVEGYVCFTDGDETIHATFLSFFGDWEAAPVLEPVDFQQVAAAEDTIRKEMADDGITVYDLVPMNTGANMAQIYCGDETSSNYKKAWGKLGDNIFSTTVDYLSRHMAVSGLTTDADYVYGQQILVRTRSLRNAYGLYFTAKDADTGEVYDRQVKLYASKSVYSTTSGAWGYSGYFYWSPEDSSGTPLASGTRVTISVGVSRQGETPREEWSFTCTVDGTKPEITCSREGDTLTVTARDQEYLAVLKVTDAEGNTLAEDYFSDEVSGQSHTMTVDLTGVAGDVRITAIDYATNVAYETVTQ